MKNAIWFAPLVLALAAVAMPATAGDGRRGHDRHDRYSHYRDHDRRWGGRWDRDDRDWDDDRRRWESRRWEGRDRRWRDRDRDGRYRHEHWHRPPPVVVYRPVRGHRGPPPWARGRDYRSYGYRNVYFVPYADYPRYRLYRPHHGYRWVRDDRGNFLLVAAATGIITSILLDHAY